jgi:hypothetical protein
METICFSETSDSVRNTHSYNSEYRTEGMNANVESRNVLLMTSRSTSLSDDDATPKILVTQYTDRNGEDMYGSGRDVI